MSKKQIFAHRMVLEFTEPKNKRVQMRATLDSENMEVLFEGEMKEVSRKRKNILPEHYHVDFVEGEKKFYWYYLGRKVGGIDYTCPKRFAKYNEAAMDAIRHFKNGAIVVGANNGANKKTKKSKRK